MITLSTKIFVPNVCICILPLSKKKEPLVLCVGKLPANPPISVLCTSRADCHNGLASPIAPGSAAVFRFCCTLRCRYLNINRTHLLQQSRVIQAMPAKLFPCYSGHAVPWPPSKADVPRRPTKGSRKLVVQPLPALLRKVCLSYLVCGHSKLLGACDTPQY